MLSFTVIKYGRAIDCCLRSFHISIGLSKHLAVMSPGTNSHLGKSLSFASKYSSSNKFGLNFSSKWILIQDTYKNCSLKSNITRRLFSGNCSKTQQISKQEWKEESPDVRVIHGRDSLAEPHRKYNSLSSEYITEEVTGHKERGAGDAELEGNPILGNLCQSELQCASESFSSRHRAVQHIKQSYSNCKVITLRIYFPE